MKKYIFLFTGCIFYVIANSQSFSTANEKMNIFYLGVYNPISFAVEKVPNNILVIKTTNGEIIKELDTYFIIPKYIGTVDISLYKKSKGKLLLIAQKSFRTKKIPAPVFKIASGRPRLPIPEISHQIYVRADLENIDYDARVEVEKFTVTINHKDSSASVTLKNEGNKLSEEIAKAFQSLQKDDEIIFREIFAHAPWEKHIALDDVTIKVY